MWNDARPNGATVMNRPLDDALPEILGTDAVLRGLRVRTALSPDPIVKGATALTLPDLGDDGERAAGDAGAAAPVRRRRRCARRARPARQEDPLARAAAGPRDRPGVRRRAARSPTRRACGQERAAGAARARRTRSSSTRATRSRRRRCAALLREAVAATRVDVDRDLLVRALDTRARARPRSTTASSQRRPSTSPTRVGGSTRASSPIAIPLPALAPATTVQQVAGVEPRVRPAERRPRHAAGRRDLPPLAAGPPRSARRCEVISRDRLARRAPAAAVARRSTAARTGSTRGSRRPRRGGLRDMRAGGARGAASRRLRLAREHRAAHARPRPVRSTGATCCTTAPTAATCTRPA